MKHMLSLGAFNVVTGEYVHPRFANKKDKYKCPDCDKVLILAKGDIRVHHFRHPKDSVNPCNHYSNPTESQIHKDAKRLIKSLLERKISISFDRKCVSCEKVENNEIPEISETSVIQEEWSFEHNGKKKIADVAYLEDGEIFCLLEICYTHKTRSEDRPEPWFEIDAETLIQMVNDNNNSVTSLVIPCIRVEKCEVCIEKEEARRIEMEARRLERLKEMEEERKRREEERRLKIIKEEEERKRREEERKRREEERRLKIIKEEEERKKEEEEKRLEKIKAEERKKKMEEERKRWEEERLEKSKQENLKKLRLNEERSNELNERKNMKKEDERRKEIIFKENEEKEEIRQKNIRNQTECRCGIRFMHICNCCEPVFEYKENLNYHWCKKCRKRKDLCLETNSQVSSDKTETKTETKKLIKK